MKPAANVFDYAIKNLERVKPIINQKEFMDAVNVLATHRVWTTGMGKAGLVANKMAATLSCNGRPAAYIHAGEALHGDFGSIQCGDSVVAFSNSGKTDEVFKVASKSLEIGAHVILITGDKHSMIAKKANIVLCYGKIHEACPLGLTPTTSTIVMMAIADALSMCVQQQAGTSIKDYARNHHSGYLGEKARGNA